MVSLQCGRYPPQFDITQSYRIDIDIFLAPVPSIVFAVVVDGWQKKGAWKLNLTAMFYISDTQFSQDSSRGLTHWGRVTHICVGKLTIIVSDKGLSPARHEAIIWNNAGILLIGPSGTNFSEIRIEILIFSFKKIGLKVSSAKWRSFCLGLNVLSQWNVNNMEAINGDTILKTQTWKLIQLP